MTLPSDLQEKTMWATSFFVRRWSEHRTEAPGLIQLVYRLREEANRNIDSNIAPTAKSADGLFESHFDLFKLDHPGIQKLHAFCRESVAKVVTYLHGLTQEDASRLHVHIKDSWVHITNNGGFHDSHYHSSCSWCGIYYLQAGEAGRAQGGGAPNGLNRFYSPLWRGGSFEDMGTKYLGNSYFSPPAEDGFLLLFPSYLMHSGLPYKGQTDRMIISFNSQSILAPPGGPAANR